MEEVSTQQHPASGCPSSVVSPLDVPTPPPGPVSTHPDEQSRLPVRRGPEGRDGAVAYGPVPQRGSKATRGKGPGSPEERQAGGGWEGRGGRSRGGRAREHHQQEDRSPRAQDSTNPQRMNAKGSENAGRLSPDSGLPHPSLVLLFGDVTQLLGLAAQPPGETCSFGRHCHLS